MKTLKVILLVALSMTMSLLVSAEKPDGKNHINPDELTIVVKTAVSYPDFAIDSKITGFVVVELTVNSDGTITIDRINSTEPALLNYVNEKLEQAKVEKPDKLTGRQYYYRFDFQLL
jgi:hypothetical protein